MALRGLYQCLDTAHEGADPSVLQDRSAAEGIGVRTLEECFLEDSAAALVVSKGKKRLCELLHHEIVVQTKTTTRTQLVRAILGAGYPGENGNS